MSRGVLRAGILGAFLLVLAATLLAVRSHERTLADGRIVLAELAPVDPRSLMQGDYMALAFAVDDALRLAAATRGSEKRPRVPRYAYLQLDEADRATLEDSGDVLPAPESGLVAMRVRLQQGSPSIGPNAFFFQEGTAERYEAARWGEFRVTADGKALLTHLRDAELERLGEIDR
jgi:uncharacterized membrane-anchored protein